MIYTNMITVHCKITKKTWKFKLCAARKVGISWGCLGGGRGWQGFGRGVVWEL